MRYFTQNYKCEPHSGAREKVRESSKSVGFILWGPQMFVPVPFNGVDVEIFHRMSENFGLKVALEESQGIIKVTQRFHPLATMNIYTKFMAIHGIVVEIFQ